MSKNTLGLRQALVMASARCALFCKLPGDAARNFAGLEETFKGALASLDDPEERKRQTRLLDRARNHDQDAITELNELRATTIDLYVRATSNFATLMFQNISLNPNEQAVFKNTYRNQVKVGYMAQDGDSRMVKAVKAQNQVFIDMRELTSDEVTYPIRDINLGTDVNAAAQATVDIGFDVTNKIDALAKTQLDALFGPFVTSGAPLSRTYIPNDRIVTANLPTTNVLVLDDNTASTQFRLKVIRTILKYCNKWGNIFGGPVRPTGVIMVPSAEVTDLADEILPTGNTFNSVAQGVLEDYMTFDYMGVRWVLVPDVTLPAGTCYPVLNRKVGDLYTKPAFDEEIVDTNRRKNIESRVQRKVFNFGTPEPWRVFAVKVTYHS
jgi:hypothetical protein